MADTETLAMQDRGPTVLAVVIALLCVSTAFIVLRLISRMGVVKRVSKDDYAIIVAWVSNIIPRHWPTFPSAKLMAARGLRFLLLHLLWNQRWSRPSRSQCRATTPRVSEESRICFFRSLCKWYPT